MLQFKCQEPLFDLGSVERFQHGQGMRQPWNMGENSCKKQSKGKMLLRPLSNQKYSSFNRIQCETPRYGEEPWEDEEWKSFGGKAQKGLTCTRVSFH